MTLILTSILEVFFSTLLYPEQSNSQVVTSDNNNPTGKHDHGENEDLYHFTILTNDAFSLASAFCAVLLLSVCAMGYRRPKEATFFSYILILQTTLCTISFACASNDIGLIPASEFNEQHSLIGFRDYNFVHFLLAIVASPATIYLMNTVSGVSKTVGDQVLLSFILCNLFGTAAVFLPLGCISLIMGTLSLLLLLPFLSALFSYYPNGVKNAPKNIKYIIWTACIITMMICMISVPISYEAYLNKISPDIENLFYIGFDIIFYCLIPFGLVGSEKVIKQLTAREKNALITTG